MAESFTGKILGVGPPCILLHGWGHSHEATLPLAELLADHYTVHALTLPGFGDTPPPPAVWSAKEYAEWVHAYLKKQNIQKTVIIGHSFGGKIAAIFSCLYPDEVQHLFLLASSGLKPERSFFQWALLKAKIFLYKALALFPVWQQKWKEYASSSDYKNAKGCMQKILVKSVNEDISSQVKTLSCPTTILWGEEDSETEVSMARHFHALISKSSLHIFPHFNHNLLSGVKPHLLARYILKEVHRQ